MFVMMKYSLMNVGWAVFRTIAWLFPLNILFKLGSLCAKVYFYLDTELKRTLIKELHTIFMDKSAQEINEIALRSLIIYFKRQVENVIYGKLTKEYLKKMVFIEGLGNLDKGLDNGKGVIILLSHFGSFLLILPALAFKGYSISQITGSPHLKNERVTSKKLSTIRQREYDRLPIKFLRADKSLYSAFKALKRNELVAITLDGRTGSKWLPVKIFNSRAFLAPGPIRIAMKTGAAIIPTFIIRNIDNTHRLVLEQPFEIKNYETEDETISANLQGLAEIFERYVYKYPCHYGMILKVMRVRAKKGIIDCSLLPEGNDE